MAGAAALVLTADADLANVHAALSARELNPSVRIVIRLFDAELGAHLPKLLPNAVALSSSALAAPGFVSAALDGEGGGAFELADRRFTVRHTGRRSAGDRHVIVVAHVRVAPDSALAGMTVWALSAAGERRILGTVGSDSSPAGWDPDPDTVVEPGQDLVVVATRAGLATLLARARVAGPAIGESSRQPAPATSG